MKIDSISINYQSSIMIRSGNIRIFIDPYKLYTDEYKADYIFISHSHYDHLSIEDIKKIIKDDTKFIIPIGEIDKLSELNIDKDRILGVVPNKEYRIDDISFSTVPSYNINKDFHKKEYNWVGYILKLDRILYFAGDTDVTEEVKKIKCDIAIIPIGGVYTMDYKEAADLINLIKPNEVIPVHYGCIVGDRNLGLLFEKLIDKDIRVSVPFV